MDSKKILEMINDGEIDKLKEMLADDIYKKELGRSGTNRYSAMKRYFKYVDTYNKATSYPALDVKVYGEKWNCFCDGYSIALTHEDLGSMECFGGEKYLDIAGIMKDFPLDYEIIDINEKIARAKSMGYKLTKWNAVDIRPFSFGSIKKVTGKFPFLIEHSGLSTTENQRRCTIQEQNLRFISKQESELSWRFP